MKTLVCLHPIIKAHEIPLTQSKLHSKSNSQPSLAEQSTSVSTDQFMNHTVTASAGRDVI